MVTLIIGLGCVSEEPFARAFEIATLDEAIGGPKAIAQPGDFLLENDRVRVAILGARNSLSMGLYGGSLIDADLQRVEPHLRGGHGLDALSEIIPTANLNVAWPGVPDLTGAPQGGVSIVADGADGGPAIVRAEGPGAPFLTVLEALEALLGAPDLWIRTDYIVEPGNPFVTLETVVRYGPTGVGDPQPVSSFGDNSTFPLLEWAMESGLVIGDFALQGGSIDVFAPGIGFDEDGAVKKAGDDGRNLFQDPFSFDFVGGTADGVSYLLAPEQGNAFVPLFTASQTVTVHGGMEGSGPGRFADGTQLSSRRRLFVGEGDMGSAVSAWVDASGAPAGTLQGHVVEDGTGAPLSGADVFVYAPGAAQPWSQFETDVSVSDSDPDGSFGGRLPAGTWDIRAHLRGRPPSDRLQVEVQDGQVADVRLVVGRAGSVTIRVRDQTGALVPSKVMITPHDGLPERDPVLGDGMLSAGAEAVVFSPDGTASVDLPDGRYVAVASRGPEYEIDVSPPFDIAADVGAEVDLTVVRSVETDGWVSADLHVHALPSPDSGIGLAERVVTMAAEGVEFFSSTDHDTVTDYAPVVEALGLTPWVQTAVGVETTTVEVGHFLGFPLHHDFLGENGGSRELLDWTGLGPDALVDHLRQMGAGTDPLVFVAHPRDGILGYFDQFGFLPEGGVPGVAGTPGTPLVVTPTLSNTNPVITGNPMSWDFDALEVLNGKRLDLIRTPTQTEMDDFAAGGPTASIDMIQRTLAEQAGLVDGTLALASEPQGQIDDWFALLNLGFRFTAIGNSDTHGTTSVEAGCPRNYVLAPTDDPAFLGDQDVAEAVRAGHVVISYGPFLRVFADGQPPGSILATSAPVTLSIEVQAPTWVPVDRVELYENGTLVAEWEVVESLVDSLRFYEEVTLQPAVDSWYVAIASGAGDIAPMCSAVEVPYVDLQRVVEEALSGISVVSALLTPSAPIPREYAIPSFALANPIWIDRDGDGFDAPGQPSWVTGP
jgi:hypothetical protein